MQRCAFRCNGNARGRSAGAARRMLAIRPRPVVSVREHVRITVGRPAAHR